MSPVTCPIIFLLAAGLTLQVGPTALGQEEHPPVAAALSVTEGTNTLARILSLPRPDVIPALVRAIQADPLFADDSWRHRAYSVLVGLNAIAHPAGVRQFIRGLADPTVSCLCIYALGSAATDTRPEVVPAIKEYLDHLVAGKPVPCRDTAAVFAAVGQLGKAARPMAPVLEGVAAHTSVPVAMRGAAARALVHASDLPAYVATTRRALAGDSLGARILLSALLLEGEKDRWGALAQARNRQALAGLLADLLAVRKEHSFREQLKGSYVTELEAEGAVLKERLELGHLLVESVARSRPEEAVPVMRVWIAAVRPLAADDPHLGVRLKAKGKLHQAEQLLARAERTGHP